VAIIAPHHALDMEKFGRAPKNQAAMPIFWKSNQLVEKRG